MRPEIVLLDEPTAVLESKEIRALFGQINRLRGAASVIFVSHRLEETVELSDRIYVMRNASVGDVTTATRRGLVITE